MHSGLTWVHIPTRRNAAFAALAAAVMLVAACSRNSTGASAPESPDELYLYSVTIAGNEAYSDEALIKGLATQPPKGFANRGSDYDPLAIEADKKRIVSYYQHRGYFSARVVDVQSRRVGASGLAIRFVVTEGERSTIESVDIDNVPASTGATAAAERVRNDLAVGDGFDHARYSRAKQRLTDKMIRDGFAHARTNGVVAADRKAATVAIRFDLDPGPLVHLGPTNITGLRAVAESSVRARIGWREGDVFDREAIERTRARLYRLGAFSSVRIEIDDVERLAVTPVNVGLIEAPRHQLRFGGGVRADQTQITARARAGYSVRGFGHPLQTFTADLRPGYALVRGIGGGTGFVGEATVGVQREDLWAPLVHGSTSVGYSLSELEAYSTRGPSARVELGRPFADDRVNLGIGWQIRYLDIVSVADAITPSVAAELGLDEVYRLAFFEESVAYDGRDSPLAPRSGLYAELRLQQAGVFAGGAFGYLRATPELRAYAPLGDRISVAGRVRFGAVLAGTLPATQRYFGGGSASHRGFPQRQLSPFEGTGDGVVGIGGQALFESSVEARVDLFRVYGQWLGVAAFVDGGDVTRSVADLDLGFLHWAVGGGLRYRTAIGPIRIDVGYRLNRYGAGEPREGERISVHLGLGEAF